MTSNTRGSERHQILHLESTHAPALPSLSERFTDAPPHMKLPGDAGTWSLRYDGREVTVSRKLDETANLVLDGDYQQALFLAQYLGVLVPGGAEEMWREAHLLFGTDAFRMRGSGSCTRSRVARWR